jgi:ADP-ribosyl-[dinitrogen reductase] hydrolase
MKSAKEKTIDCILGGAIGDALGNHVEFISIDIIRKHYGSDGITGFVKSPEEITDDTQMTLFTIEGLINMAGDGSGTYEIPLQSYHRWLTTQKHRPNSGTDTIYNGMDTESISKILSGGNLVGNVLLNKIQAPGNTCLNALIAGKLLTPQKPDNNSKGCGGVMRAAPAGLSRENPIRCFITGCKLAALTHGHPSGYLSAGAFAVIINLLMRGFDLSKATSYTLSILKGKVKSLKDEDREEYGELINRDTSEVIEAIEKAVNLFNNKEINPSPEAIEKYLGGGWVGEEALSIALYSGLVYQNNFKEAICLAVNHSGDSDSTGAICGNIVGIFNEIPDEFRDIELYEEINDYAGQLYHLSSV